MTINFIFSNDTDEECVMHSKSDNIEIMIDDKVDEVVEKYLIDFCKDIKLRFYLWGFIFDYIWSIPKVINLIRIMVNVYIDSPG